MYLRYDIDIQNQNVCTAALPHGISTSYLFELSDKYFEMSCPMDFSITNICIRDTFGISSFHSASGPCRLGSLASPSKRSSDPGCHCLLCRTLLEAAAGGGSGGGGGGGGGGNGGVEVSGPAAGARGGARNLRRGLRVRKEIRHRMAIEHVAIIIV